MKFQTHYSRMGLSLAERACYFNPGGGEYLTVPDQTLPLRTLVERYVQRREVPVGQGVFLEEDSVLHDFHPESMDHEERLEFAEAISYAVSDEMQKRKKTVPASAPAPASGAPAPSDSVRDDIAGV